MKRILLIALFAIGFIGISNLDVKAQLTTNHAVSVAIPTLMDVTNSSATTAFTFATLAELSAGLTQNDAIELTYRTNKMAKISVNAQTENFTSALTPTAVMSAGVLSVINGETTVSLTTDPMPIATSLAKGQHNLKFNYKLTPGLASDPAADYAITVVYTISAN